MTSTYSEDVIVKISPNLNKEGKLRGINYEPGFAVVKRNDRVIFQAAPDTAVLIVFPDGSPFEEVAWFENTTTSDSTRSHVKFTVKPDAQIERKVSDKAERKKYKYVVALKRGEDALLDGGCPEIFVDM